MQAENKFRDALVKAQIANLIKKDEDVPGIASFVIEAIVGQAFSGAKAGLKILRSKGPAILRSLSLMPGTDVQLAADAVAAVDENSLVAKGTSSLKKAASKEVEDELKDASEERKATSSYLSQLQTEAEVAWEQQREAPPGYASDAELVALFHSWGTSAGHTMAAYEAALKDKVARYQASPASRIGKTAIDTRSSKPLNGDPGYPEMEAQSLRVTMEVTDGEHVRWMYYSYNEDIMDATPEGNRLGGKRGMDPSKFTPLREVEPEFMDIAIRNNQKEWGVPYDTKNLTTPAPYKPPADYVPKYVSPTPVASTSGSSGAKS